MKIKMINFMIIMCIAVCTLAMPASADVSTIKASVDKCTYSDGIISTNINIDYITKGCKAVFAVYDTSGQIVKVVAKEIDVSDSAVNAEIPVSSSAVGYKLRIHFIYGVASHSAAAGESLSAVVSAPIVAEDEVKENSTVKTDSKSYAVFITGTSSKIVDDGTELNCVNGYVDSEEVEYSSKKGDISGIQIGKMGVPVMTLNLDLKYFIMVGTGSATISSNKETYGGKLTSVDGRRNRITIDDKEFKIKPYTNVYVYDSKSSLRRKYITDETADYLSYDDELGIYIDSERTNLDVTAYVCINDGKVLDLLYYIN